MTDSHSRNKYPPIDPNERLDPDAPPVRRVVFRWMLAETERHIREWEEKDREARKMAEDSGLQIDMEAWAEAAAALSRIHVFRTELLGHVSRQKCVIDDDLDDLEEDLGDDEDEEPEAYQPPVPEAHREIGRRRAAACKRALREGVPRRVVAAEAGVSASTLKNWIAAVRGVPEEQWEHALIPRWKGPSVEISDDVWRYFLGRYLRRSAPSVAQCWRETKEAAAANGWGEIPSTATFERRVKTHVEPLTRVFCREGPEEADRQFPDRIRPQK